MNESEPGECRRVLGANLNCSESCWAPNCTQLPGDCCVAGFRSPLCPLWVSSVGAKPPAAPPHVRFASESGQIADVSVSPLCPKRDTDVLFEHLRTRAMSQPAGE